MTGKIVSHRLREGFDTRLMQYVEKEVYGIFIFEPFIEGVKVWFSNEKDLKEYAEWKHIELV